MHCASTSVQLLLSVRLLIAIVFKFVWLTSEKHITKNNTGGKLQAARTSAIVQRELTVKSSSIFFSSTITLHTFAVGAIHGIFCCSVLWKTVYRPTQWLAVANGWCTTVLCELNQALALVLFVGTVSTVFLPWDSSPSSSSFLLLHPSIRTSMQPLLHPLLPVLVRCSLHAQIYGSQ